MDRRDFLDSIIPHLKVLSKTKDAKRFFDLMSGGFVWSDEKIYGLTENELGCLRAIFRYRTSLIVKEPDHRFEELWKDLKLKCPSWIGFDIERCSASDDLIAEYRKIRRTP